MNLNYYIKKDALDRLSKELGTGQRDVGRPTKYTKETPRRVLRYIKTCNQKHKLPTIEDLASVLGVGTRTLYAWETEYSEFLQTMDMLRDVQRDLLIRGGLTNKYNANFAALLLKAKHGFVESKPTINATQNNTFNVSPELLAEAIRLTRLKDTNFMES